MMRSAAGAAALILLIGCAAGGTVYRDNWRRAYDHSALMFFHGGKDMRLVVRGAPAGMAPEAYRQALAEAMSGRNAGLPIRFTETPTETASAPGLLIVTAAPAAAQTPSDLCRGEASASGAAGGDARELLFVYCQRDLDLASLRLRLPAGAGPQDAAFAAAVGLATRRLLPLHPPGGAIVEM